MKKLLIALGVISGLVILIGVLVFFCPNQTVGQDRAKIKPYFTKIEFKHFHYFIDEYGKLQVLGNDPVIQFRSSTPNMDFGKVNGIDIRSQLMKKKA